MRSKRGCESGENVDNVIERVSKCTISWFAVTLSKTLLIMHRVFLSLGCEITYHTITATQGHNLVLKPDHWMSALHVSIIRP